MILDVLYYMELVEKLVFILFLMGLKVPTAC